MGLPERQNQDVFRVRNGCDFLFESTYPTPMMVIVRPREVYRHRLLDEVRIVEPEIPVTAFTDSFGNVVWRCAAPVGSLHLRYDCLVEVPATPDPFLPALPKPAI